MNTSNKLIKTLSNRICKCGCESEFEPVNSRHIYYNHIHANYAYNHGKRKSRLKIQNTVNKILSRNDRICEQFYNSVDQEIPTFHYNAFEASGIDLSYTLGRSNIDGLIYYHTYNYLLHLFEEEGVKKITIRKKK